MIEKGCTTSNCETKKVSEDISILDRYLTVWIFLAMITGAGVSHFFQGSVEKINDAFTVGGHTNLLLAFGLILMMYPPLAEVRFGLLPKVFKDIKALGLSLLLNWVIGPLIMFGLAIGFFAYIAPNFIGQDARWAPYMAGLLLVGIARCVAMVLIWNRLAGGSSEYGAAFVALNSIFQIITFGLYAWIFISVLPTYFGMEGTIVEVKFMELFHSVLIYLGIPFALGILGRYFLIRAKGAEWYENIYLPKIAPLAVIALIFTIFVMFSLQGERMLKQPFDVLWIAIPMSAYFLIMFLVSFFLTQRMGIDYRRSATLAFTASGNNFELAIAVGISVFGIASPVAFATAIGPLVEVPVLIGLVHLSLYFKRRFFRGNEGDNLKEEMMNK
ncbi:arsenic resistance protein [Pedobacter antarcticus 4BY]|uniref:Arsenic resistance protein n=2 Tax=Pedobacter antarcticus TaxID=34086 RepID=A0A081PHK0_9SPHI|nr:ACR3 family arsenite efflux transporter [Pedobacter antarcticus]KEQ30173.1 arsenic resistance protein [Pedobacter antarcticus 4BY]SFE50608.1 arsenite transporter, ACR3 family [Pedobacter antarcticus]